MDEKVDVIVLLAHFERKRFTVLFALLQLLLGLPQLKAGRLQLGVGGGVFPDGPERISQAHGHPALLNRARNLPSTLMRPCTLSAEVFRLSDAVLQGNYDQAASILGDLLKMQTEPILILAALGSQLRRIWTARLALDSGRDRYWLMELWGMKSDYPAKLLLSAARRTTGVWCAQAVRHCQELDRRMKSERGIDGPGELKLLLVRLAAERS